MKKNRITSAVILLWMPLLLASTACEWGIGGSPLADGVEEPDVEIDMEDDVSVEGDTPDGEDDPPVDVPGEDAPAETVPDAPSDPDAPDAQDAEDVQEEEPEPCSEGDLVCEGDGARRCEGGVWVDLGACPLGCDETAGGCYVPSNVPPELVDDSAGDLDLGGGEAMIYFNTDTGGIRSESGTVIRDEVEGYDPDSGITFTVVEQGPDDPSIGVFSTGAFTLPGGVTLRGEGDNALALAASGDMVINGIIDVCASGQEPGPGGGGGGDAGEEGEGACPGLPGETCNDPCGHRCSAGGGGGGFGGVGGQGGDGTDVTLAGGDGGGPCGTPELSPLIGGSGGGGGGIYTLDVSYPGPGGGGGGAVQLVSASSIVFGGAGGIHAGGDGGGECDRGGGGGGGAGGAALIEAPDVDIAGGAIIAANGGGGGGGDCS